MGIIADPKRCCNVLNVSCLESNTQYKRCMLSDEEKEAHQRISMYQTKTHLLCFDKVDCIHTYLLILLPFLTVVTSFLRSDTNNGGIVRRTA